MPTSGETLNPLDSRRATIESENNLYTDGISRANRVCPLLLSLSPSPALYVLSSLAVCADSSVDFQGISPPRIRERNSERGTPASFIEIFQSSASRLCNRATNSVKAKSIIHSVSPFYPHRDSFIIRFVHLGHTMRPARACSMNDL